MGQFPPLIPPYGQAWPPPGLGIDRARLIYDRLGQLVGVTGTFKVFVCH